MAEVSSGGPGLAFVTIPEAITQMPFGATFFAVIFFATIFFLAIDSAMAMVETGVLAIKDYVGKVSNEKLTGIACLVL
ncbi:MAG: hypothetical protein H6765_08235 [Candidatus Peribacteria bacterium]|nr:MAG: hypothetical protein H6765_08235 [Candidatus Peribacteria bacterium]